MEHKPHRLRSPRYLSAQPCQLYLSALRLMPFAPVESKQLAFVLSEECKIYGQVNLYGTNGACVSSPTGMRAPENRNVKEVKPTSSETGVQRQDIMYQTNCLSVHNTYFCSEHLHFYLFTVVFKKNPKWT